MLLLDDVCNIDLELLSLGLLQIRLGIPVLSTRATLAGVDYLTTVLSHRMRCAACAEVACGKINL